MGVTANEVDYYLVNLKLSAFETQAIDIRKLRDAQKPDSKGNKIPAAATDGDVLWSKMDSVPVVGRVVVFNRRKGLASNFDCQCLFKCPKGFVAISESPTSASAAGMTEWMTLAVSGGVFNVQTATCGAGV